MEAISFASWQFIGAFLFGCGCLGLWAVDKSKKEGLAFGVSVEAFWAARAIFVIAMLALVLSGFFLMIGPWYPAIEFWLTRGSQAGI